jgi:hypothetical protein
VSIRFPKKNIAQSQFDRRQKPKGEISEPQKTYGLTSTPNGEVEEEEAFSCPGLWGGKLYPHKLWQLHNDIKVFFYTQDNLPPKERKKLVERMPFSMQQAEKKADEMLFKFVQHQINTIGVEAYGAMVRQATNKVVKTLFALRCMIAASATTQPRQTIRIFRNKAMSGGDFFPVSCRRNGIDPDTGEKFTYYVDRPNDDDDDVYWRSENHKSSRHDLVREILGPKLTKRDKMPANFYEEMQAVLEGEGIVVNSHDEAWKRLNEWTKVASIEDQIVSRIMYLIANAIVHKKVYFLPDKKRI